MPVAVTVVVSVPFSLEKVHKNLIIAAFYSS